MTHPLQWSERRTGLFNIRRFPFFVSQYALRKSPEQTRNAAVCCSQQCTLSRGALHTRALEVSPSISWAEVNMVKVLYHFLPGLCCHRASISSSSPIAFIATTNIAEQIVSFFLCSYFKKSYVAARPYLCQIQRRRRNNVRKIPRNAREYLP